ncbi:hypothetical protein ET475_14175 [Microbacterium protaetiae]|uniref:Uncharacterized protein n=1 Tax=Microbacterium protaetiae TaxID=2509458 RepID=A0A4P6EF82_9MICO|nr:hypothetical protein [Microbacterium protaetiae]QAY61022.1 hypothetical protein ET475_14175 [Microbacterium protaetiae]
MTNDTLAADKDAPLTDDTLLTERVLFLLERANLRQFWMMFLDEHDVQAPTLMPCDDLPVDPCHQTHTDDLGTVTHAELLAARIAFLMEHCEFAQAVFVWERRGGPRVGEQERAWARELGAACVRHGVRVRAQFLLHDRGVRVLAPDDYL